MKNWQLYKHDLRTDEISKAYPSWHDMTEKEAETVLSKISHSPIFRFFIAPIGR